MKKNIFCFVILLLFICSLLIINNNKYNIKDSVIYIEAINDKYINSGSGFVYKIKDNRNYIITGYHVVQGYTDIYVYNNDRKKVKASILSYDEYSDIAILIIKDSLNLKEISIGNSENVNINDEVNIIGTPLSINNINTISDGKIVSNNRTISLNTSLGSRYLNVIEIFADVDKGNSGGPVLDKKNRVIGMMFLKDKDISYALPINFVIKKVNELENKK